MIFRKAFFQKSKIIKENYLNVFQNNFRFSSEPSIFLKFPSKFYYKTNNKMKTFT